jgi:hypothetical protein
MGRVFWGVSVLVLGCLVCGAIAAPAKPTYEGARGDFDAGKYQECLSEISGVLAMPDSRKNLDQRYDLFMLRGEALLQLKIGEVADDAFHAAAMVVKNGGDPKKFADAEAMSILIKVSPGLKYQPKDKSQQPIDIVPMESRKAAMLALLDDRLREFQPKAEAALSGTSLVPMIDLVPTFSDLFLLELAATGESKRTMEIGKALGGHARDLINPELRRISDRIQDLNALATEPSSGGVGNRVGYRGLTSPERQELQDLANELVKIQQVATRARQLAKRMGGNVEAWEAILAEVDETKTIAQKAYDRRY